MDTNQPSEQKTYSKKSIIHRVRGRYKKHHIAWGLLLSLGLALVAGYVFQSFQQTIISATYGKGDSTQVVITTTGVEPKELKIKSGTKVNWTNRDKRPHQIAADPYPTSTSIANFNNEVILQEDDQIVHVFEQKGTYTYHDKQDPYNKSFHGIIIVQ